MNNLPSHATSSHHLPIFLKHLRVNESLFWHLFSREGTETEQRQTKLKEKKQDSVLYGLLWKWQKERKKLWFLLLDLLPMGSDFWLIINWITQPKKRSPRPLCKWESYINDPYVFVHDQDSILLLSSPSFSWDTNTNEHLRNLVEAQHLVKSIACF